MRSDAVGLFWQDVAKIKGGPVRSRPKIKSKWRPVNPADWPNLRSVKRLAIDTETYDPNLKVNGPGWARGDGHIVGFSISVDEKHSWYFPMRHTIQKKLNYNPEKCILWLKDNIHLIEREYIGANITYDIGWLREEGVHLKGSFIDVISAEKLLVESRGMSNLDDLGEQYLKTGKTSDKLYKWLARYYGGTVDGSQRKNMYRSPVSLAGPYAISDAVLPLKIYAQQYKKLKKENLLDVFNLEMRLIPLLIDMRFKGVRVDIDRAEKLKEELLLKEQKALNQLKKTTGVPVNVNSSKDLERVFDRYGIDYNLTKAGNGSFTKIFLENCPHKIARLILEIREVQKLRSTFIESGILNKHINGIVHCQFNPLIARSGRLSSTTPNLQNIPIRTELGKKIRECFIPFGGYWWRADYSQIEYRTIAHDAVGKGAKKIRKLYRKNPGTDYHKATQLLILKQTDLELGRKSTKTINFGLAYGMSEFKLTNTLGLSRKGGAKLFDAYHRGVPFVRETFNYFMDQASRTGIVTTLLGRRSRFDMFEDYNGNVVKGYRTACRAFGEGNFKRAFCHKGLNRRSQGTAADIMKASMVAAYEAGVFDVLGIPSLTVHDELDGSCEVYDYLDALQELKYILENTVKLKVPLITEFEYGHNWGQLYPCKLD